MPVKRPLSAAEARARMIDKLAFSALDAKDAKTLGFTPMTAEETKKLKLPAQKAGFAIPYFDMDGAPSKFFRFRYMEDTRTGFAAAAGAKGLRYAQPPKSPVELYLPPLVDWRGVAGDVEIPLIITEGELKSACATKYGIPTVGLGGVWSFQVKTEGTALLPVFDEFEWDEREVYICYDSDGATNPQVVMAEARLAKRLSEKGARVLICRLPPAPPNEADGKPYKVGIDDYIVAHGVDAFKERILHNAFEYAESAALHELNKRVVYVRDPGIVWDHEVRQRMAPSAFKEHAFSNLHYFETRVDKNGAEKMVKVPTAKAWMEWAHRAECTRLTFEPGGNRVTEDGALNMWEGWGLPHPEQGDYSEWTRLLDHLFGEDVEARTYFERWCAWPLQNPGKKMSVAAAIWGPVHGSGKSLVGYTLMRIYGRHSIELKDSDLEDARFEWAENKQFVMADDITARGDRKFMRKLMTMITQRTIRMNPKFIPSYSIPDTINYYYTSNDPDALFMDDQDRRFFVHEVRAGRFPEHMRYVQWMNSASGPAALWDYLMGLDMGDFDPHMPPPDTVGKEMMKLLGKSELGAWVADFKANTDLILKKAKIDSDLVSAAQLHMLFDPNGDKRATQNALSRELKRAGFSPPSTGNNLRLSNGRQLSVFVVRNQKAWMHASWSDACKYFEDRNPQLVDDKKASKKF